MIPVHVFAGRKVAVFGLGVSGVAAVRALLQGGAHVSAWDDHERARGEAAAAGLPVCDLSGVDWRDVAALVLAPGVPLSHPEPHWTVKAAREAGVEIIGDTELFLRERARTGSKARVIAITGTNGKSTTTALTAHVLRTAGRRVALGGNIGTAILALEPLADDLAYVIELSSFQIDLTPGMSANAAALLNIAPDHLDRHGTFANYVAIKARVFSGLGKGDAAVIGVDDAQAREIAERLRGDFDVLRISSTGPVEQGVFAQEGRLVRVVEGRREPPVSLEGIRSLRGVHNWQNAAAAYALAASQGVQREAIEQGLRTFAGLPHRMEEVGRMGPVLFINDSKATNADAAAKALAAFDPIYWIAGGLPKSDGIDGLEAFYPRIARAYLIGKAAEGFAAKLAGHVDHVVAGTLEAAVAQAARDAATSAAAEPVVLLSPACASYDQFDNFAHRGERFRAIVAGLGGVVMRDREAA